jgi:hypothetical protein
VKYGGGRGGRGGRVAVRAVVGGEASDELGAGEGLVGRGHRRAQREPERSLENVAIEPRWWHIMSSLTYQQ